MNPVFYQYYRENNILDGLIQEFAKRNWLFDKMPYDYFHQYRWPDIILSEKKATLVMPDDLKNIEQEESSYAIELLGCYDPDKDSSNEGRVVLFMPKIHETTKKYIRHLKQDNSYEPYKEEITKYVELLSTLVLIHEFTHWIVQAGIFHTVRNTTLSTPLKLKYDDKDSIFFHETIAQIFTNFFCCNYTELKTMFYWLEEQQPIQYQMYKKLLCENGVKQILENNQTTEPKNKLFHIEVRQEEIEKIIFSLMVLRVNDRQPQSYYDLHVIYDHVKSNSIDIEPLYNDAKIEVFKTWNWNRESFEIFKEKYRGKIQAKKFGI
jgi:hypothetical protein